VQWSLSWFSLGYLSPILGAYLILTPSFWRDRTLISVLSRFDAFTMLWF